MKIKELFEAKEKATFKKFTSWDDWAAVERSKYPKATYKETTLAGETVGVLYDGGNVVGMYYHKPDVGSFSEDWAKLNPKLAGDFVAYSDKDPAWPRKDGKKLEKAAALVRKNTPKDVLFKKYTDFDRWNDNHGGDYDESEIDGYKVGILYDDKDVIGLWYHRAGIGSICLSYSEEFPKEADDIVFYSEEDPHYPYD